MKGIIVLDEIPENCSECDLNTRCGMCLVDGGRCDYKSKVRPSSCPIKNLSDVEEYNKLKEENTTLKAICNALI